MLVDVPTLLALLEGVGLGEDPSLAPLLPYLRASGTLAGGGHQLEGGSRTLPAVLARG